METSRVTIESLLQRVAELEQTVATLREEKQRSHLLGCLYDLSAEPTNNRAERSLRLAVISRKISCGNKTDRGRRTWQVLASLAAKCVQRSGGFIDDLAAQMPLKKIGNEKAKQVLCPRSCAALKIPTKVLCTPKNCFATVRY